MKTRTKLDAIAELVAACEWVLQDMAFKAPEQFAQEKVHGRWMDRLQNAVQAAKSKDYGLTEKQLERLTYKLTSFGKIVFAEAYWFSEYPGRAYCLECAQKNLSMGILQGRCLEVEKFLFCEECGRELAHTLTEHGAEQELLRLEKEGVDLSREVVRYTLSNIGRDYLFFHADRLYALVFPDGG